MKTIWNPLESNDSNFKPEETNGRDKSPLKFTGIEISLLVLISILRFLL